MPTKNYGWRAAARAHGGISERGLRYRVNVKGMTLEQALSLPVARCGIKGDATIRARAKAAGVKETTYRERVRKGDTGERLTRPARSYVREKDWF